ncbi:TIGR03089 family protein [Nakamurella sp. A5-74]|uniref:TIGR03089 family protein n=1 Tax=Nakamurella sp. A5-74 TaxID=3158264 RepID=A0AAU8DMC0_9ACTN
MASPSEAHIGAGSVTDVVLGPLLRADLHVPRLVTYSPLGRTELSTASLGNWSAKVAGLLRDELGLSPGSVVSVRTADFWQSLPILLGCWWNGAVVTPDDDADAAVAFVADGDDAVADDVFVVSGHPLGAPSRQVAAHQRDFTTAVLGQADRFDAPPAVTSESAALSVDGRIRSVGEVLAIARSSAGAFWSGIRVASTAPWTLPEPAVGLLLGTLLADGVIVQISDPAADVAAIAATEHCSVQFAG